MATQKQAKEIREGLLGQIAEVTFEGAEYVGRTSEGAVFQVCEDFVAIRTIVKSETFDLEAEMADYAGKIAKAEKAAKERAAKVAKAGK